MKAKYLILKTDVIIQSILVGATLLCLVSVVFIVVAMMFLLVLVGYQAIISNPVQYFVKSFDVKLNRYRLFLFIAHIALVALMISGNLLDFSYVAIPYFTLAIIAAIFQFYITVKEYKSLKSYFDNKKLQMI